MEKRTMRDYVYLTPSVLRQQLAGQWEEPLAAAFAARPVRILRLVASGSSYNAALCVRPYLRKWLDCEVLVTEPFTGGGHLPERVQHQRAARAGHHPRQRTYGYRHHL